MLLTEVAGIVPALTFDLPAELEAHEPPEARGLARDEVRLMVSERNGGVTLGATFRDLPMFLDPGDLIVVNDSATIPAAIGAASADGEAFAVHLSGRRDGVWTVEPRGTAVHLGDRATLPADGAITFLAPHQGSPRLWKARLEVDGPIDAYIDRWGKPIAYSYVRDEWPIAMYQTVYARRRGSAEMPSAGRAFSGRVIDALRARGVRIAPITLHTGVASLESDEAPYEEWFQVSDATARLINRTRRRGGRIIAVGTTVIRALESAADARGRVRAASGWTGLVITPSRGIQTVDGLLTGFHEPRASHLLMLEALVGRPHLRRAYAAALRTRYLWHEFGDLHLILRS